MGATKRSTGGGERSLGPVLDFMRALWALDHRLQSASKRMEGTLGVTGPQRLVIRIVGQFPGISAGQVAGLLHIHPSTLTGVLKRLDARGALTRKLDPGDARRSRLSLTARGERMNRSHVGTVEAAVKRVLAQLPTAEVDGARAVLELLALEVEREGLARSRSERASASAPRSRAAPRTAGAARPPGAPGGRSRTW